MRILKILNPAYLCLSLILLSSCSTVQKQNLAGPYNRSEWSGGRWADANKDCLNTRHEVLKARSLVAVKKDPKGCRVITGQWQDFYSKDVYKKASLLEIDHVVPVKLAHELSQGQWSPEKKRLFYNDMDNLVVTSKKHNASKGANDILMWQPAEKLAACRQMQVWMKIKKKYNLKISAKELEYQKLLKGCLI